MTWQTLRTFAAQAVETGIPLSAVFVLLDPSTGHQNIEFAIDGITLAGVTKATLAIWRYTEGKIDQVGSIIIEDTSPVPVIIDAHGERFWVTVDALEGGAAFTGVMRMRIVRLTGAALGMIAALLRNSMSTADTALRPASTTATPTALSLTSTAAAQFGSAVALHFVMVSNRVSSPVPIYVSEVGAETNGLEIKPGDPPVPFFVSNANALSVNAPAYTSGTVTVTATAQ